MVDYSDWVKAVNEAYVQQGGVYDEDTAAELIEIAARFWQRNKSELKTIAYREAVRLAERKLNV
jgi:hypothetical protein